MSGPEVVTEQAWMTAAACLGASSDLFFLERGESSALARATCAGCPVRQPCLEYALANNERVGIWGGLTAKERYAENRRRQHGALKVVR